MKENGKCYIGADKMISGDGRIRFSTESKIFRKNGYTFAFCGGLRESQILRYQVDFGRAPNVARIEDVVCQISELSHAILKEAQLTLQDDENFYLGSFLVSYGGKIFSVHSDFSVVEPKNNLFTDGSGGDIAMGAMLALKNTLPPIERIKEAIKIASICRNDISADSDVVVCK